jgi:hypothetical protein
MEEFGSTQNEISGSVNGPIIQGRDISNINATSNNYHGALSPEALRMIEKQREITLQELRNERESIDSLMKMSLWWSSISLACTAIWQIPIVYGFLTIGIGGIITAYVRRALNNRRWAKARSTNY